MGIRSRNSNLRVLSTAYAAGKLSKEQYRALRTKQLSALEFGKPLPPLPPGLSAVNVPDSMPSSTNFSAKPVSSSKKKTPLIILSLVIIIAVFGSGAYILLQTVNQPSEQQVDQFDVVAEELKERIDQDIVSQFAGLFAQKSDAEQAAIIDSGWAKALLDKTNKSISGITAAKEVSGGVSKEVEKRLAALRRLAGILTPVETEQDTVELLNEPELSETLSEESGALPDQETQTEPSSLNQSNESLEINNSPQSDTEVFSNLPAQLTNSSSAEPAEILENAETLENQKTLETEQVQETQESTITREPVEDASSVIEEVQIDAEASDSISTQTPEDSGEEVETVIEEEAESLQNISTGVDTVPETALSPSE